MFDELQIEMHRTIRELTARAEAKVRAGQLGLAFEGLVHEGDEQGHEQGQHVQGGLSA